MLRKLRPKQKMVSYIKKTQKYVHIYPLQNLANLYLKLSQ